MSSSPELNKNVPAFSLPSTSGEIFKLKDFKGKNLVLYFYPRDATPGCTIEGQDFRDQVDKFKRCNTLIFGVSRDNINKHLKFKDKQNFNFELLSDEDETVCKLFDVMKLKNMYGKKVRGIERSTFVIDTTGVLRHEWRKVKIEGHVQEVLDVVKSLKSK